MYSNTGQSSLPAITTSGGAGSPSTLGGTGVDPNAAFFGQPGSLPIFESYENDPELRGESEDNDDIFGDVIFGRGDVGGSDINAGIFGEGDVGGSVGNLPPVQSEFPSQRPLSPGQQRPLSPGQQRPLSPGQQRPLSPVQQRPPSPVQQRFSPPKQPYLGGDLPPIITQSPGDQRNPSPDILDQ